MPGEMREREGCNDVASKQGEGEGKKGKSNRRGKREKERG